MSSSIRILRTSAFSSTGLVSGVNKVLPALRANIVTRFIPIVFDQLISFQLTSCDIICSATLRPVKVVNSVPSIPALSNVLKPVRLIVLAFAYILLGWNVVVLAGMDSRNFKP